jgi:hypothetical protein
MQTFTNIHYNICIIALFIKLFIYDFVHLLFTRSRVQASNTEAIDNGSTFVQTIDSFNAVGVLTEKQDVRFTHTKLGDEWR